MHSEFSTAVYRNAPATSVIEEGALVVKVTGARV
jgi:hypothetical protein